VLVEKYVKKQLPRQLNMLETFDIIEKMIRSRIYSY